MLVISDLCILSDEAISLPLKKTPPAFISRLNAQPIATFPSHPGRSAPYATAHWDEGLRDELSRGGFSHIPASITDTSRDSRLASTYGHVPPSQGMRLSWLRTQPLTFPFYVLSGKCPAARNNTTQPSVKTCGRLSSFKMYNADFFVTMCRRSDCHF